MWERAMGDGHTLEGHNHVESRLWLSSLSVTKCDFLPFLSNSTSWLRFNSLQPWDKF